MKRESEFFKLIEIGQPIGYVGLKFHIYLRNKVPNVYEVNNIEIDKWSTFRKKIEKSYKWNAKHRIVWKLSIYGSKANNVYFIHLQNKGISIYFNSSEGLRILYDSESDLELVRSLKKEIEGLKQTYSKFNIGFIQSKMDVLCVKFREFKPYKNDVIQYLGEDLIQFKEQLIHEINQQNRSGLYLLHGKPGTGKTSFIKSVLSETDKDTIFITPAFTESLTAPNLINLLMDHPDTILVIEDAETVLMKRQADNSNAVSNLLNLTDGFPADFLNLNIICTFNTNIENIDPALLREGRLSGIREFKKLNPDQANLLAEEMGYDLNTKTPMTLAEICNYKAKKYDLDANGIGF
ncbi:MAG: AAA family ATPase [Balneola sp.]